MNTFVLIHGAGDLGWAALLAGVRAGAGRAPGPGGSDGPRPWRGPRRLLGEHEVRRGSDAGAVRDDIALFYQDVPQELASEALKRSRRQSEARLGEPSPLAAWPDVPTRVLLCRDDRLFPVPFIRRVARERLGITPDEIDSGHTPALSRPKELAGRLETYAAEASVNTG